MLASIENKPAKAKGGKTVEDIYQKKTQLEHILLRPDTYIGSVEPLTTDMYVLDAETERLVSKNITYVPGLYKIFDEILVNAADNKQRDLSMDRMEIDVDAEAGSISVKNNGKGIPIVMHKEEKVYIPELIFGHLLTGSNFDDGEKKTTGGRNGFGAKLANIFSTSFTVECVDMASKQKYVQEFTENMGVAGKPKVTPLTKADKADYVKITFVPDLARFKMDSLDADTVALLSKRAYDMAGCMSSKGGSKMSVYLNGSKLPIKSFKDYVGMYDGLNVPSVYEKFGDRWEVGIATSKDEEFQSVSFVNSICTSKGGGHVDYIEKQVNAHLMKALKKKNKSGVDVKANIVKANTCIYVNCLIENPTFDSQTKDNLTSRPKNFGSKCELPDKFLKALDKSGIIEAIIANATFKAQKGMKKLSGTKKTKIKGIPKVSPSERGRSEHKEEVR
ncbi:hypothetical protein TeGR_g6159 [Tetraparma gracilis]|uniref:DNA topoisomerase 2 n=1 Tax=Tetraparma gracilis TaxID=2962635 RepID=A0ABQ6MBS6_9STRA|nr:hypothetical protein TeGR_g6159 [Tetraparma gracilis]